MKRRICRTVRCVAFCRTTNHHTPATRRVPPRHEPTEGGANSLARMLCSNFVRLFIDGELYRPLKPERPSNDHLDAAMELASRDPGIVGLLDVLPPPPRRSRCAHGGWREFLWCRRRRGTVSNDCSWGAAADGACVFEAGRIHWTDNPAYRELDPIPTKSDLDGSGAEGANTDIR